MAWPSRRQITRARRGARPAVVVRGRGGGVPYKWGADSISLESFSAGVKKGKAAGDVCNPDKRRLGGDAVSSHAVGIDCSGFISRCWKLDKKYSTDSLPSTLHQRSASDHRSQGGRHHGRRGRPRDPLLAKWLDDGKTNAQFYESSPYMQGDLQHLHRSEQLKSEGFRPLCATNSSRIQERSHCAVACSQNKRAEPRRWKTTGFGRVLCT